MKIDITRIRQNKPPRIYKEPTNLRRVIAVIRFHGPVRVKEVAWALTLSQQSCWAVVYKLWKGCPRAVRRQLGKGRYSKEYFYRLNRDWRTKTVDEIWEEYLNPSTNTVTDPSKKPKKPLVKAMDAMDEIVKGDPDDVTPASLTIYAELGKRPIEGRLVEKALSEVLGVRVRVREPIKVKLYLPNPKGGGDGDKDKKA